MAEKLEQHHEALGDIGVVLDEEDARAMAGGRRVARRAGGDVRGDHDGGQPHDELRAAPDPLAPRLDPAAVELHEPLHDGEPDPDCAHSGGRYVRPAVTRYRRGAAARKRVGTTTAEQGADAPGRRGLVPASRTGVASESGR